MQRKIGFVRYNRRRCSCATTAPPARLFRSYQSLGRRGVLVQRRLRQPTEHLPVGRTLGRARPARRQSRARGQIFLVVSFRCFVVASHDPQRRGHRGSARRREAGLPRARSLQRDQESGARDDATRDATDQTATDQEEQPLHLRRPHEPERQLRLLSSGGRPSHQADLLPVDLLDRTIEINICACCEICARAVCVCVHESPLFPRARPRVPDTYKYLPTTRRRAYNDIIFKAAAAELLCRGAHITIDFIITRDCGAAHACTRFSHPRATSTREQRVARQVLLLVRAETPASAAQYNPLAVSLRPDRVYLVLISYRKCPNAARIAIHTNCSIRCMCNMAIARERERRKEKRKGEAAEKSRSRIYIYRAYMGTLQYEMRSLYARCIWEGNKYAMAIAQTFTHTQTYSLKFARVSNSGFASERERKNSKSEIVYNVMRKTLLRSGTYRSSTIYLYAIRQRYAFSRKAKAYTATAAVACLARAALFTGLSLIRFYTFLSLSFCLSLPRTCFCNDSDDYECKNNNNSRSSSWSNINSNYNNRKRKRTTTTTTMRLERRKTKTTHKLLHRARERERKNVELYIYTLVNTARSLGASRRPRSHTRRRRRSGGQYEKIRYFTRSETSSKTKAGGGHSIIHNYAIPISLGRKCRSAGPYLARRATDSRAHIHAAASRYYTMKGVVVVLYIIHKLESCAVQSGSEGGAPPSEPRRASKATAAQNGGSTL
ncbi:unnamed protein product [Trichogramma brassicae]|uniref:Uncharacterized protein n=1 Tax=Trichogramma brassicae TaxID=86971 RepID=A0A6H5I6E5_9HYME|nr:unnamed protein product [Trichogramma brassicae]